MSVVSVALDALKFYNNLSCGEVAKLIDWDATDLEIARYSDELIKEPFLTRLHSLVIRYTPEIYHAHFDKVVSEELKNVPTI